MAKQRVIRNAGTTRQKQDQEVIAMNSQAALKRARSLITLPEKLAGDKFSYRNHLIPNAIKHFPYDFRLRFVDLYFPYAVGGPLYVDFAIFKDDEKRCLEKEQILHLEGCRYICITPNMTEFEAREKLESKLVKGIKNEQLDHSSI